MTIPATILLIGLIVLVAGGAALCRRQLSRRYPRLADDEHNDILKFTYGFIGFVYALFIGFMISALWGQLNAADANARGEGAVAAQMASNSTAFAEPDGQRIRRSLLAYANAAIAEWPDAGIRRSAQADAALTDLRTAYAQVQATTDTQKTFLATSWTNLDKISEARTERILTGRNNSGLPWPLWAVIFLTSAMVLGTAVVYGADKAALHYPMVVVVGIVVATNLFLVLELAHPYVGGIAVSADPLREAVWQIGQSAR